MSLAQSTQQQPKLEQSLLSNKEKLCVSRAPSYEENGRLFLKRKFSNMMFTSYGDEPEYVESWMQSLTYQQEVCPTSGKLHWQCFVEFKGQQWGGKVQKHFGIGPGVKDTPNGPVLVNPQAANDPEACIKYCSKSRTSVPGTFRKFGTYKAKGTASKAATLVPTLPSLPTLPMEVEEESLSEDDLPSDADEEIIQPERDPVEYRRRAIECIRQMDRANRLEAEERRMASIVEDC